MSTKELLHEIESLPKREQVWLLEKLTVLTESEIPESFRQGMKEAERGELVDMDDALKELDRP
jgi:predicted transcriptional regulator